MLILYDSKHKKCSEYLIVLSAEKWYNLNNDSTVQEINMKICVAGLGIIGGSLSLALKRAGYEVDGCNRSALPLEYALNNAIIDRKAEDLLSYDFVFVALPPKATLEFINGNVFKDGAIVSDICGVKKFVEDGVFSRPRNFRFVGCHPMAGKEVSGIENACADLFDGASMIITKNAFTDGVAYETVKKLVSEMGFGTLVECSAEIHDRKIAYTSQLAHVLSNAYVKDGEIDCCLGFTGGSFQDMTRIAGVDENMWAELFMENSSNVSEKIGTLTASLNEIKCAIDDGDGEKLREVLARGRVLYEESKKTVQNSDIFITKLK